jgi:hypothetical protein
MLTDDSLMTEVLNMLHAHCTLLLASSALADAVFFASFAALAVESFACMHN